MTDQETKPKPNRDAGKDRPAQSDPDRDVEAGAERAFTRAELVEDAHGLLGVPSELMAGALALGDARRVTYTLSEAEKLVEKIGSHESVESEVEA